MDANEYPTSLEELHHLHMADMKALRLELVENTRTHEAIRQAFIFGLGVDILDSSSVKKFHEEHTDLLRQRQEIVKLQIWVGRAVIALCATIIGAVITKLLVK